MYESESMCYIAPICTLGACLGYDLCLELVSTLLLSLLCMCLIYTSYVHLTQNEPIIVIIIMFISITIIISIIVIMVLLHTSCHHCECQDKSTVADLGILTSLPVLVWPHHYQHSKAGKNMPTQFHIYAISLGDINEGYMFIYVPYMLLAFTIWPAIVYTLQTTFPVIHVILKNYNCYAAKIGHTAPILNGHIDVTKMHIDAKLQPTTTSTSQVIIIYVPETNLPPYWYCISFMDKYGQSMCLYMPHTVTSINHAARGTEYTLLKPYLILLT